MLLDEPDGDSHDGRNGATWAETGDAMQDGPLESRLGAIRGDGSVYANHPPGLGVIIGVTEAIGEPAAPLRHRTIPILALSATVVLTFWLLRSLGFSILMSLVGVAGMAATPMARAYGSLVDTPMLALPFAAATITALVRTSPDDRRLPWWGLVIIGIGPLVSWQLLLLNALLCIALVLDRRRRPQLRGAAVALGAGCAALLSWLLWVHEGTAPVLEQFLLRSGLDSEADRGLLDAVDYQLAVLPGLLGAGILLIPVAALAPHPLGRVSFSVLVASTAGYLLLTSNGAAQHDYWLYWTLLLVALGAATAAEGLKRRANDPGFTAVGIIGLVVLPLAMTYAHVSDQERSNRAGVAAARLLEGTELPQDQDVLWLLADIRPKDPWLDAYVPAAEFLTSEKLRSIRSRDDDPVVLASTACHVPEAACDALPFTLDDRNLYPDRRFALLRVSDLDPSGEVG
ncbi:MAG: hypothetical protein ACLGI8_12005 [Acidimicrobiia bacterium]